MNNLKKIGLTALGTALVATSASAADFSISGSTSITYAGHGTGVQGNNWGMGDSITFKTSGEMDNGLTISYQYEIDNGATGAKLVTIGTDGMGTLQFAGMDNSGPISAWDDITPNANEENKPYNQNSIPAYDQNNQNIGRFTKLDNMSIINP